MSDLNRNPGAICLRVTLVFFNILYMLIAVGIIGFSVFVLINSDDFAVVGSVNGGSVYIAGGVILLFGLFVLVMAIVGIIGAMINFWPLLLIYSGLMVLLLCGHVTLTILPFVYEDNIENHINNQILVYIKNYTTSGSATYNEESNAMIDLLQSKFQCCGLNSPLDWGRYNLGYTSVHGLPESCGCQDYDKNDNCYHVLGVTVGIDGVWKHGCNETIRDDIKKNMKVFGGISGLIGSILILTLALSSGLALLNLAVMNKNRRYSRLQNPTSSSLQEITYTAGPADAKEWNSHNV